jgi:SAM-dependent methyltransferase
VRMVRQTIRHGDDVSVVCAPLPDDLFRVPLQEYVGGNEREEGVRNGLRICAGSGQRPHGQGWINLDIQERWRQAALDKGGEFLRCDMNRLPFPEESASLVIAHQVCEHAGCNESAPFVSEAYRVLKPGGSLLVFVPDMFELARGYLDGKISTQIYMTNVYGAYMGDEADRHRWGFDRGSLYDFLRSSAPWSRISGFNWRDIPGTNLANAWWVLDAEAVK